MSFNINSSVQPTWIPENIVISDNNFLSRSAILEILHEIYPESRVSVGNEFSDAIRLISQECKPQSSLLLVVDFSGDKQTPLAFYNTMRKYFARKPNLKVVIYTSVEDCFFISSVSSFISGGVILKKEPVRSIKKLFCSLSETNEVLFSDSVHQLVGDYRMPSISPKAIQGYFAELAENQLSVSSRITESKYKTFYSRRYNTVEKLGFKSMRQYYVYLSKINDMLYR
ncbi:MULTISPECIES: hypothetical protein [unclassified Serratia (in: enterobacteria)]|uniref:hypothetical protein n=1 Tax=unclassified Serratia (in: enterobacteria) TaxID=2647522 RepID=UPI003076069C